MIEQEQQAALRAELLAGIQGALSGPRAPAAPAPLAADATQAQKDAHNDAVRDHAVLTTLSKSTGDVSVEERAELLRQLRECAARGWQ